VYREKKLYCSRRALTRGTPNFQNAYYQSFVTERSSAAMLASGGNLFGVSKLTPDKKHEALESRARGNETFAEIGRDL
jgi:hypothetical protein